MKYILLIAVCVMPVVRSFNITASGNLEDDLKNGYKKTIRPAATTQVGLAYGLMHMNSLDIVAQQVDIIGFAFLTWEDSRLVFDPLNYDNITYTTMLQSDIWIPPLVLNNGADGLRIITDDDDVASNYAYIFSNGEVQFAAPASFISQCIVSIRYYPFDSQECHLIITPWAYGNTEINLYASDTSIALDLFEENGEWELAESKVINYTRSVGGGLLSAVRVTMNLQRKYSYYLINMILPIVLLAVLGCFVFILPVESGEKNGFSLTILLSMSVMMTIVSDLIPPIATQTCLLSVYLLVVFIISSLQTAITVFSCQIHQYTAKGYKPSRRMQKMTVFAAKVSCYRRPEDTDEDRKTPDVDEKKKSDNDKDTEAFRAGSALGKKAAWDGNVNNDDQELKDYSYEEIAFIFDRVSFIIFAFIIAIFTFAFFIGLSIGGAHKS